jgi:CubicO group peptidase (beta-lactamase class C family)
MQNSSHGSYVFSSARLERITDMLTSHVEQSALAGAVARICHNDDVVYDKAVGWADIESSRQMNDETIFMIMSMSKPITAVAMMVLYEEGHFDLNTPVRDFIPAFGKLKVCAGENDDSSLDLQELEQDVTIRHLFTHTSGLSYGGDENDPVDREYQRVAKRYGEGKLPKTMATMTEDICSLPLAFQPGTQWRYGFSTDVLGALVEIISGLSFDVFLEEKVFMPLGMVDTAFFVPNEKVNRIATTYTRSEPDETLQPLKGRRPPNHRPDYLSGGGGLVSTINDYANFCQMFLNRGKYDGYQLLSPTTVSLFSMNHTPDEAMQFLSKNIPLFDGFGCGLSCWVLLDTSKTGSYGSEGEFGWSGAYNTYFWVDPKESFYAILMSQQSPNYWPKFYQRFKRLTYQSMV